MRERREIKRARVWVSGFVQGVGFRHYAVREAERRGVKGWVRNLPDGRVELLLQGESDAVESMIAWCRKGPPYASVKDVAILWEEPEPGLVDFHVEF
jgi:acylphosphatase